MDTIWDRKSFEVGGHWRLWRGEKTEWPRRTDKSWMLFFFNKNSTNKFFFSIPQNNLSNIQLKDYEGRKKKTDFLIQLLPCLTQNSM